ncbi:UNVERIFIED_CONTAM: hypothetical protein Scaly_2981800 [Sesamum calycinum]|uniref:Uncharacterized protein n=1 Tax=Sesamum calycinum TaxID=2727403 RepID=A0AAW2KKW9_9LAMI
MRTSIRKNPALPSSQAGPGGILNALATALHGSIRTAPSIHRLRLGLLGYLIPFAPLAFVSQCQCRPAECFRCWSSFRSIRISPLHRKFPLPLPYSSLVVSTTCPGLSPGIGFDGGLKKPPTDALRPIIPDNACILCLTAAAGTELADAYSPRHSFFSGKSSRPESGPCLSPSVADHPLGPATDHRLGKLLPHQLANQTQAPPRADSSFCSSAYGVLAAVSSCCSPPKAGSYALLTRPPLETPLPVRLACVKHAASVHPEPGSNSPCASYSPGVRSQKYSHPALSRQSHEPLIHSH